MAATDLIARKDAAGAPGSGYAARTLVDLAAMEAIAQDWRALESRATGELGYFQSYGWCRNWIAAFGARRGGPTPFVRTVWRGKTLVAVLPLMVVRSGLGMRTLRALGEPHSQYCTMLSDPAAEAEPVQRLAMDGLLDRRHGDVAVFNAVPAGSRLSRALAPVPRIAGYANESSVLDLSIYASSEAYTAQLGKLQKRNRNRRRNHLAREGALSFSVIWPGHPDFAGLVRIGVEMKQRWLKETGRFSTGFSMAGHEAFLAGLEGDEASLSGACLSVLRAGERVVAVELGFVQNAHYYAYLGGFDWELRHLSPGKVQMDMTVCWLIDRGIVAYDLLANPADYKQSWSNREVELRGYAAPLTWKGRVYAEAWLPTIRPAIKRLYGLVPELARRLGALGQGAACLILYV